MDGGWWMVCVGEGVGGGWCVLLSVSPQSASKAVLPESPAHPQLRIIVVLRVPIL